MRGLGTGSTGEVTEVVGERGCGGPMGKSAENFAAKILKAPIWPKINKSVEISRAKNAEALYRQSPCSDFYATGTVIYF